MRLSTAVLSCGSTTPQYEAGQVCVNSHLAGNRGPAENYAREDVSPGDDDECQRCEPSKVSINEVDSQGSRFEGTFSTWRVVRRKRSHLNTRTHFHPTGHLDCPIGRC
jgi:hypothetical protein